ncbi:hypothetical protein, partial [Kitasatospora saccharophila]|uniref:hypothetical protein n=1 Tax=Kitasatospora saccharophila TaxID=407973 RepID=UPI0031CF3E23
NAINSNSNSNSNSNESSHSPQLAGAQDLVTSSEQAALGPTSEPPMLLCFRLWVVQVQNVSAM